MRTTEELLQAVVQLFVPQFASGATLVCTSGMDGAAAVRQKTGLIVGAPGALPDAILHDSDRKRLFLLELSTSHGGFSAASKARMDRAWGSFSLHAVCMSVFPSRRVFTMRKSSKIVWGTVAWFADEPAHIISFGEHGRSDITPYATRPQVG